MKVYSAGLINKPLRQINTKLRRQITSDLKKYLQISSSDVASQELNTFILTSGKTNGKAEFKYDLIDKVEKGSIPKRFSKYYREDESRFRNYLKRNQELRETAQIIKDFIKKIDSSLPKQLDKQLNKINTELPRTFCELSTKSFITLWDIEERQEYRFYLSGFDFPVFTGSTSKISMDVEDLVDEFIIANFFVTFLKPTLFRLDVMERVLNQLEQEVEKQHYRTSNQDLQEKFELFLRILMAKLSALQELDTLIYRIFNLFEIPRVRLMQYNIKSDFQDFNTTLARISEEINLGKSKLQEVSSMIQRCQLCIRDYLDEGFTRVKIAESVNEFKEGLRSLAELSVDIFVEAELLKIWSDYFGSDIPYY
ncbi:MAG: hypothetical protein ACFE95_17080, partial [Candidatus Hodarchaeota archaeon]